MLHKILSYAAVPVVAAWALIASPTDALAQRGGGHVGGSFRGGGSYGAHYGARPGVVGGYHPNYSSHYYNGYGYHPYYGYHSRPFFGFGLGYYPYYDYGSFYPNYASDPPTSYYSSVDPNAGSIVGSDPNATLATVGSGNASPGGPGSESPSLFSLDQPVHITVRLPVDAELWFEGKRMSETGSVRTFTSPTLTHGRRYTYTIRARWVENGTATEQTRTVTFEPGNDIEVNFPVPSGTGARSGE